MKQVKAKLIIWSLNILIQWDKLFNHWPHADKVYMATKVDLSITFQAICSTWTGFLLQQVCFSVDVGSIHCTDLG